VIAAVIAAIMRMSISPATRSTAIGAAQLTPQSTPRRQPSRQPVINVGIEPAMTHARRQRRSCLDFHGEHCAAPAQRTTRPTTHGAGGRDMLALRANSARPIALHMLA